MDSSSRTANFRDDMNLDALCARVLEAAAAIQQIPAPTFAESKRGDWMHAQFLTEPLAEVSLDEIGNVYARLPGQTGGRPIVVSAHLDSVFPLQTDLTLRRTQAHLSGAGIGDNALGLAGLLGLMWLMRPQLPLQRDLWLVANVGEEGLGDLRGMRRVVERFQDRPVAYLVLEGMALGIIYHRGLGVARYRIAAHTQGGHAWVNFGRPSAIHELVRLAARIAEIQVPETPRASFNIGVFSGGISVNTIAAEAVLELDLRAESQSALQGLVEQVLQHVETAARAGGDAVRFTVEQIGRRPWGALPGDHPLIQLASRALQNQGLTPRLEIGSTDANLPLSYGYPAICIGLTTGRGAHTLEEQIDAAPLAKGLAQLQEIVLSLDRLPD